MAPFTLLGAAFNSHGVEHTVGHNLLVGEGLSVPGLVIVLAVAFALTSLFNVVRIPTSTIQILVFCVVGAGLAAGVGVHWATIGALAILWLLAPLVAAACGYLLTHGLDRLPGMSRAGAYGWFAVPLVAVGALASFTMGSNDVANATGALVGTHTFSPLVAGTVGGAGLAAGVLSWGRPLLRRVSFDIVTVDRPMASAAQLVQAGVVLAAVGFGLFTSMNQALVGAMVGAAAARGRHTVHRATLLAILRGWVVGPSAGLVATYGISQAVLTATGSAHLLALLS